VLAAASHALAGGEIAPLGLAATVLVALPMCVALAGRPGSLWRLGFAVVASQFLYHWSFVGVGGVTASGSGSHAHHDASALALPTLDGAGADATMWGAHAIAAALTIVLLARGEAAARRLGETLARWLPMLPSALARIPARSTLRLTALSSPAPRHLLAHLSPTARRGPPVSVAPAH